MRGLMQGGLLNVLFPRTCIVCGNVIGDSKNFVCKDCTSQVNYIEEPRCYKCGKGIKTNELYCEDCEINHHFYDKGICVFEYEGPIKKSMYKFKYENKREYGDFYGREAVAKYLKVIKQWHIDALVPVPVFKKKERQRGYNQAEIFARAISKYSGIPLIKNALVRTRNTSPQKELTGNARKNNLENAFALYEEELADFKNILIVDDIYTTGSTIDACAKVLKAFGINKVYFVCVSSGNL